MAVDQQSNIRIALASVPNIVAETPEDPAFRCDQRGMFICIRLGALSENEKIWSASNIRIALASAPKIVAETPEDAAFRCDQRGIMDNGFCAPSKNERIWSASGDF